MLPQPACPPARPLPTSSPPATDTQGPTWPSRGRSVGWGLGLWLDLQQGPGVNPEQGLQDGAAPGAAGTFPLPKGRTKGTVMG